ncbi:MAG: UDP-3-O-(3-hydroxymyristoyl)glucosamine N-acyltransferase [Elusimicrobiota bacterium]
MKNDRKIKLKKLVSIIGGEIQGNPEIEINGINSLDKASEGDISFLSNARYKGLLSNTKASCVIVPLNYKEDACPSLIKSDNVELAVKMAARELLGKRKHPVKGISSKSSISPGAEISGQGAVGDYSVVEKGAFIDRVTLIYPSVYIGQEVSIGKNCIIYPGVKINSGVKIGDEVIIHSGAVIGSDGFGYTMKDKHYYKTLQRGAVKIEDRVEIGANTTIDRGAVQDTLIGEGTKIDNLVQIGHNVKIGKNCIIVSQAGIAGSTVLEDGVVLAGQVGVTGHITIGRGARVGAQAGVTRNVPPGSLVSGYPATEHKKAKKLNALIRKLPGLYRRMEILEKEVEKRKS